MQQIFTFLAALAGIYSLLIIIRIILSWFSGTGDTAGTASARTPDILYRITDPYLDWWRRSLKLRVGYIDLSPVVAIVFLSVVQRILHSFATSQQITLGGIIDILLSAAWSIATFILGFFFIVLLLRLIAYLTKRNIYSPFWQMIETI
jgi:YggT family protein